MAATKGSSGTVNAHSGAGLATESQASTNRRLSPAEVRDRQAKGLCFTCNERWNPTHRCPFKQLQVMIVEDENDDEGREVEAEVIGHEGEGLPKEDDATVMHLSMQCLLGLASNQTLKAWGEIQGSRVVVMIDCGASSNFIGRGTAERLGLVVTETQTYNVEVGDGHKVCCQGVCKEVTISLQGTMIVQDLYIFDLGSTDVVLGLEWLTQLGEIKANFKDLTLKFMIQDREITIKGDPSLFRSEASLKSVVKALHDHGQGFFLRSEEERGTGDDTPWEDLEGLLAEFEDVFHKLTGLPPRRQRDHAINLKPGSVAPNIRPYRYPHYQKSEIESLVAELLGDGLIRPSTSPYSSPMILVKKKDGSWRVCVDYRALNKLIIQDKFPIPVVDELLDELGGSMIFSKLDLKSGFHQIRMREEGIPKTAFRTHQGHYEYLVMPFGLTNAPSSFQALMNDVLRPFLRKFALVFFDDIMIYSKSKWEHLGHLRLIFEVLRSNSLVCNRKKCSFGKDQMEYLGHVITAQGVSADPSKVQAMRQWPAPKNIKGLRGVFGTHRVLSEVCARLREDCKTTDGAA
ncbi:uncharacterized protein LOC133293431 [Gastrolobium bilobum]|uniref:uncharacterized protein LOC133293431 n=1 Tax=Gastrolobium bilobum TaxID=150636 RepID=UPI002AB2D88E|nr:uncharacterized protein LOC133293431 [Gastrolobium bilobum]